MRTFTIILIVARKIATTMQVEAIDLQEAREIATDLFGIMSNIKII